MAKAHRPGGLYYVGDTAVDAENNEIEGAPEKPKDTHPSEQPGALGGTTAEERMAIAIANAIVDPKGTIAAAKAKKNEEESRKFDMENDDDEDAEEAGLPTLADLPDHLETITTVKEVKALQKTDDRVGAQKFYDARLEELKNT